MKLFYDRCREHGIESNVDKIFQYLREFPEEEYQQLSLF